MKLMYLIFWLGVGMCIVTVLAPRVIERPHDLGSVDSREYSVGTSGLIHKNYWLLKHSMMLVVVCIGGIFFYSYNLDRSLTCENDLRRLRRGWKIYCFMLLVGLILSIGQIGFAVFGLFTIESIQIAHVFHSKLFLGLTYLLFLISFFLFTFKCIKAIHTLPPSVILSARRKDRSSCEAEEHN
jgi:hypothetical protein